MTKSMFMFIFFVYVTPIAVFWALRFMQHFGGENTIDGQVNITHEATGKTWRLRDKVAIFIPVINIMTLISYLREFIKAEE